MQNFKNYYQILGLTKDATPEEIKKAYRRLARQYHPDVNPGNKDTEERFKDINEAYDILSDPEKRSEYQRYSQFWRQKSGSGKGKWPVDFGWGGGNNKRPVNRRNQTVENDDYGEYSDFNSFVDQLIGRRREIRQPTAEELQADQMYRPNRQRVSYTPRQTGWESEETQAPMREPRESRESEPRIPRQDIEAVLTLSLERAYVGGIERIKLEDGMTVEVDLPAAMITGQQIRLRGQGKGGGDLYLKIIVSEHLFFQLEGSDIFCELPITPCEAVLGGEIEVPTIDGLVKVKLPPGVSHGQRLRLANKGYPDGQGERGDQLVELVLVTTKDISPEEKELYEKIREIEQFKPRQDLPV